MMTTQAESLIGTASAASAVMTSDPLRPPSVPMIGVTLAAVTPRRTGPRAVRLLRWLDILGLNWFAPLVSIACGEPTRYHLLRLVRMVGLPAAMVVLALLAWSLTGRNFQRSGFSIPGPAIVWTRLVEQIDDWRAV